MRKIYDRICYQDDDNSISGVLEDDTVKSGEELETGELATVEAEKVEDAEKQHEKDGTWPDGTPQWVKDRVNKTTRQKYELKTALERANARAEEAEKKLKEKASTDIGVAPTRDAFEDEDQYLDARAEWNYNRLRAKEQETRQATATTERHEQESQTFNQKVESLVESGTKKHADFVDVITAVPGNLFRQEVVEAIAASGIENGNAEDVAWFLANNLDQAERVSKLDPLSRAAALGVISTKLSIKPTKKTTNTPTPVNPVAGKGGPSGQIPDDIDALASLVNSMRGK
jgi:hypothetical protein